MAEIPHSVSITISPAQFIGYSELRAALLERYKLKGLYSVVKLAGDRQIFYI